MDNKLLHRRSLLTGGAALASWALSSARPAPGKGWLEDEGEDDGRNLVLVQLTGGNDGLNTVVPYADDVYYRERPSTAVAENKVLKLDDYRGLHPDLKRLRALFDDEKVAIVEGVGYPNQGRSHFKSLEIWHTAHPRGRVVSDGWIGRMCQAAWPAVDNSELVVHVGSGAPFSVHSESHPPVMIASPTSYRWFGDSSKAAAWRKAGAGDGAERPANGDTSRRAVLSRLRRVLDVADTSSVRVRRAASEYEPTATYPKQTFAANLRDIAAFIHGGLGTRVFSCELTGFDTHAKQATQHNGLMRTLDEGLGAFMEDLSGSSLGRDTLVVVFSEFGRRVAENESAGHDHGHAGPVLVLGQAVKGGLHGRHPSMEELDQGDLTFTTDFRSVYASVIEDWFGLDSEPMLFGRYPKLALL